MWFDVHRALSEIENDGHDVASPAIPANQPVRLAELASLASLASQHCNRSGITSADLCDDALGAFEERAAIRVFDGGQFHAQAEEAALVEAAKGVGLNATTLKREWAKHPDAVAYLAYLRTAGPKTCSDAAAALNWESIRAWHTEARLRAAGSVKLDGKGRANICDEGTNAL